MRENLLQICMEAGRAAGKIQLEKLGKLKDIQFKDNQSNNLVTEADKESEEVIFGVIRKYFPEDWILSEESGDMETKSDYKWIIDPLDGTVNYAHSIPIFSVSIGVEHNGEIIAGIVYDPSRDEMFSGIKNGGAFLNNQKIKVSSVSKVSNAMLVTGFPYNIKENPYNCMEHFTNFTMNSQGVRRLGSAAIDACYVACGRFDGFWEVYLNPWDMAAASLIVKEAGGKVSNFNSVELNIYKKSFLATNGIIHQQMKDILNIAGV